MPNNNIQSSKLWRALSIFISAIMIVSIITPITTHSVLALDVPQPNYPANNTGTTSITDPPVGVPSFSWSAVSGATMYRLQVDNEIGFNTPITMDITTPNTTYTPSNTGHLFADGDWYWRVRVDTPAPAGAWSDVFRFTKTWATIENTPVLTGPDDFAILTFIKDSSFSWNRVLGAAKYRFQISSAPDFATTVLSVDTLTNSYQPNNMYANGVYYWRVIPMDNADHLGAISAVRSFTLAYGTYATNLVPLLYKPDDEAHPTFTPTFHWQAVEGAENYRLEYTSEENCDFSVGTSVVTRQTTYTPTDTFPNDKRYCWHVRVESGSAVGDWSETRHFQKQWYLQPVLLTPTNSYKFGLYPLYSWTPVPGASRYKIEISKYVNFSQIFESSITANTTYSPQSKYEGTAYYYWRVTPIDGGGELGRANDPQFEYQSIYTSTAPIQVYPLYYYPPNNYGATNNMNPVEDRTVPYPIFIWHRVMVPSPTGGAVTPAYRIQVDDYPPYFSSPVWQYDTENTSASPTVDAPFTPVDGQIYWWRVCPLGKPLDDPSRACLKNSKGEEWWSQVWQVRFDDRPTSGLVLPPTVGASPQLLRPAHAQESVEATPLLEWWPLQGATQYQVEVSRDPDFLSPPEISELVNIPAYSPTASLAQRSLGRTDYGTFYWRVRGYVGSTWSDWSNTCLGCSPWRFQIASQSGWTFTPTTGVADSQFLIGTDPAGDEADAFDLTNLYAHESNTKWYFGFNANLLASPDMTYVVYFDIDNEDGSGAPSSPSLRNYSVTTIPAHQPEYAIYIDKVGGVVNNANTWVFTWDQIHGVWDYGQQFSNIAGANLVVSSGYLELQLPYTAIGMSVETGSSSVMAFSVDTAGNVQDTVPADPQFGDPQVPGSTQLSRFSSVSDHMNLIYPPNTASGDPTTLPSVLPLYWDWPTGSFPLTPFAGSVLEVHLDPQYTNLVGEFHMNSTDNHFGDNVATFLKDLIGDNIYYWRIQPRYWVPNQTASYGAWTGGWSFRRLGFTAQNLQTSVNWATPTFSWDMVEGADTYRLQVSTDQNFFSTVINQVTPMTTFTPLNTLAQGTYYWRVQVNRFSGIGNDWSQVKTFTLTLPVPTIIAPSGTLVHYAPTMCWAPLIKLNDVDPYEPILTAWRYRVQVSRDINFSSIYETVDTNNTCWTPTKGYADGAYFWHVAMIDGNSRQGPYSLTATFTKQYPTTTLISPVSGDVTGTPTFIWEPVDGAATYVLQVSRYKTFSSFVDNIETFNTIFTPTKTYATNTFYYWRVAIKDRNGNQGPFTDARILGSILYLPLLIK